MHNAKNKILLRQIGHYPEAALDKRGYAVLNTAFMVVVKRPGIRPEFLLAVLNSNVIRCFWLNRFKDDRQTFPKIKGEYLKALPIPTASSEQQKPLERLVVRILAAKATDPSADTSALEREIDEIVYRLYGLTPDEIALVEGQEPGKAGAKKAAAKVKPVKAVATAKKPRKSVLTDDPDLA